ncbi:MAG TPA: hypothetical protein VF306_00895 [Pirellulales bacterium]
MDMRLPTERLFNAFFAAAVIAQGRKTFLAAFDLFRDPGRNPAFEFIEESIVGFLRRPNLNADIFQHFDELLVGGRKRFVCGGAGRVRGCCAALLARALPLDSAAGNTAQFIFDIRVGAVFFKQRDESFAFFVAFSLAHLHLEVDVMKRGASFVVGSVRIGAMLEQRFHGLVRFRSDRLNERSAAEAVSAFERQAKANQRFDRLSISGAGGHVQGRRTKLRLNIGTSARVKKVPPDFLVALRQRQQQWCRAVVARKAVDIGALCEQGADFLEVAFLGGVAELTIDVACHGFFLDVSDQRRLNFAPSKMV